MSTTSKTAEKLRDPEYRKAFVSSQINVGIPFQLRALMKARGWTQADLAKRSDMLQPRISGLLTPGRTRPNIDTLRRLAEAFDCGLVVRFAPFSELVRWSEGFDPEAFAVPDFENDAGFVERKEPAVAGMSTANVAAMVMASGGRAGGTSSANIGNGPQMQSLFRHFSAGTVQAESMQRKVVAIPLDTGGQSPKGFGFPDPPTTVIIDHRRPQKNYKENAKRSRRQPLSRRGSVYA